MAVGFLTMVTLFLLGLAALLWLGAARGHPRLVWTVFGICVLPSLSLVARADLPAGALDQGFVKSPRNRGRGGRVMHRR
jgi:hypothetical protein